MQDGTGASGRVIIMDATADDPRVADATPQDRGTRTTRAISRATAAVGSFPMILVAAGLVVVWLVGGAFVKGGYGSTSYQLPVSTVSSIVTFVMVFIIQSSQNRDSRALQAKVDAIASVLAVMAREQGIEDRQYLLTRLVGLEDAPEREIGKEQTRVRRAADETAHATAPER
jgi:low affinity Fe/Cu permease